MDQHSVLSVQVHLKAQALCLHVYAGRCGIVHSSASHELPSLEQHEAATMPTGHPEEEMELHQASIVTNTAGKCLGVVENRREKTVAFTLLLGGLLLWSPEWLNCIRDTGHREVSTL